MKSDHGCHSCESRNPEEMAVTLDSRLRGNDRGCGQLQADNRRLARACFALGSNACDCDECVVFKNHHRLVTAIPAVAREEHAEPNHKIRLAFSRCVKRAAGFFQRKRQLTNPFNPKRCVSCLSTCYYIDENALCIVWQTLSSKDCLYILFEGAIPLLLEAEAYAKMIACPIYPVKHILIIFCLVAKYPYFESLFMYA
ncbi:MAG: hypothetical protein UY29_C0006G0034 [Parcubacteria group bacterium GW2011_GWC2_48_17]|nr:MAG: hypothetical protein UY29_C0006G0034 [Parcubacteria group bacterium GW2011_GWC2_48_17]